MFIPSSAKRSCHKVANYYAIHTNLTHTCNHSLIVSTVALDRDMWRELPWGMQRVCRPLQTAELQCSCILKPPGGQGMAESHMVCSGLAYEKQENVAGCTTFMYCSAPRIALTGATFFSGPGKSRGLILMVCCPQAPLASWQHRRL